MELDKIKLNPNNPRFIKDEKFKSLVKSLVELPVMTNLREIVVDEENVIIGGNMRFRAAKEAGWKEIPTKVFTREMADENNKLTNQNKTYAQYCKEIMIKDNISGGEWDWELLSSQFEKEELEDWGMDIDKWVEDDIVEDEVPEVTENPVSKLGEVYQLGRHRIMCGDSTKIEDVEKLMDGKKADMVFTDPPYGMDLDVGLSSADGVADKNWGGWKGKKKNYSQVIGDDKPFDVSQFSFLDCKEQFWWGGDYYVETIPNYGKNGCWFVWNKTTNSDDKKQVGSRGSQFELCWSKQKHTREVISKLWRGLMGTETQDIRNRVHPTQKPVEICTWFINKFSKENESVIDLFLGSGSTLIACEQTNRICYGMEIDPKYIDVIRKRYAKFINSEDWESATPKIL